MSGAYYNEFDPYAVQWLRNLIAAGLIAPGDVDDRSIVDVRPDDLAGYTQAHFFAGIGGWSLALRLAGWADDRPVWTGSCPCQPFSAAGKRKGTADARHLWPEFRRLIAECNPPVVFGEQVASADGRTWLAGVRADLEALAYAVGAADLCAASVGAPHIRQRLWWVADADKGQRRRLATREECISEWPTPRRVEGDRLAQSGSATGGMGDADDAGSQGWDQLRHGAGERAPWEASGAGGMGHAEGERRYALGDDPDAPERHEVEARIGGADGFWSAFDLLPCTDGKARRVEPGTFPLAHGVPNRVGRLRAYGNAIVPQVAAEFIAAFQEAA